MVDPVVVREWLRKAEEDYRFAEASLRAREGFYPQICFHFQQAAEKYLKTCIVAFELEFRKTHDLAQLLDICKEQRPDMDAARADCEFLNDFYIESRYPVHWPTHYNEEEAERAHKAAGSVRVKARNMLAEIIGEP